MLWHRASHSDVPCEITRDVQPLRLLWDGVISLPLPPAERAEAPANVCRVWPHGLVRLADDVRCREEREGLIVQVGTGVGVFNPAAGCLLELARRPVQVEALVRASLQRASLGAQAESILSFIDGLLAGGILEGCADDRPSRARWYGAPEGRTEGPHLNTPLGIEVEITNKCFRHCSYCAYESGPRPRIPQARELSTQEWEGFFEECASLGVVVMEFTGGDPFVRDDALDLMRIVDDLGIAFFVNSDLSILATEHVEILRRFRHLMAVQTSLDGSNPGTCDFTRGPGGFKTLVRQLGVLREAGLKVSAGTTVHAKNFHDVRAIAEVLAANGAWSYYIGPMYPAGRGSQLSGFVVTPDQWDRALADFAAVVRERVIRPADAAWDRILEDGADRGNPVREQLYLTPRGTTTLRIDPQGNAYVSAKLRSWHRRFWVLGSIQEFGLDTIWHSSRLLGELRGYDAPPNLFDGLDVRTIAVRGESAAEHRTEIDLHRASA